MKRKEKAVRLAAQLGEGELPLPDALALAGLNEQDFESIMEDPALAPGFSLRPSAGAPSGQTPPGRQGEMLALTQAGKEALRAGAKAAEGEAAPPQAGQHSAKGRFAFGGIIAALLIGIVVVMWSVFG